jgi:hypothetical protein
MSAGHSAPTLPTATRAAASQVGIRARERGIPAESPSHAEAQWHEDSPYSLTVAGAAPDLPFEVFTGFPFHPPAARPADS